MSHYLISFFAGYLVGSIPTAYLIVKQRAGIDIQEAGSGKAGAFNTFSVTQSKWLGIFVGVLDGAKGFAVTWVALHLLGEPFWVGAVGMLGAIVGHTFSFLMKFKGGRGLATAAGGFFGVGVGYTIVWCSSWVLFNRWKKDIVTANVLSSVLTPLSLIAIPSEWLDFVMFSQAGVDEYRIFAGVLSVVLLISHRDVVRDLLRKKKD
ncbi:MAG TPA: glycerol-3-phosphate acyltransferase [Bacteroidota bacterium]